MDTQDSAKAGPELVLPTSAKMDAAGAAARRHPHLNRDGEDKVMELNCIWPEVFTNPEFEYESDRPELETEGRAIADGLNGWGNCFCGGKPPSGFGDGMVKICRVTGSATLDELMAKSQDWKQRWDNQAKPA